MERQPILGDRYYPSDDRAREARIAEAFGAFPNVTPLPALAVILPQGSLDATGSVAAAALAEVEVPDVVVVLSCAHAGKAPRGAIATVGAYRLPGARVPVDTRFAEDFAGLGLLEENEQPHAREHATEAALPLLLARNPRMRIVPVVFGPMPHATTVRIGNALADCVQNHGRDILLVATTALASYLPAKRVEALDARSIESIERLDGAALADFAGQHPEALDGSAAVGVLMAACRALGRHQAVLVQHSVITPNLDRVSECVGQASFIIR